VKIQAAGSSEESVTIYQNTRRNVPEGSIHNTVNRFRMSENRMLRRIFRYKREEETGERRISLIYEFHNLCCSLNVIKLIK
jgi:PAS domain-containing protein